MSIPFKPPCVIDPVDKVIGLMLLLIIVLVLTRC